MHHHNHHCDDHNARHFEAAARRGWGGFRANFGKFGDWGGFGDNLRIGRMLASGDLRLVALYFIAAQPRHGYDLIKAVEEKTSGIYTPSPGVIYPALTFLEEAGYVTSTPEANKRLYTITTEGTAHLEDNRAAVEATLEHLGRIGEHMNRMKERWADAGQHFDQHGPGRQRQDRDLKDVLPEVNEARRDLKDAIASVLSSDEATQRRLAGILRRAAADIRQADIDL